MKGVILAGGAGSRLQPLTKYYGNKHLVPIEEGRPMFLYPLETLKLLGCKEILLITSPDNCGSFVNILKDGSNYGVEMTYRVQRDSDGILGALKLAKNFVGDSQFAVILGDNYFTFNKDIALIKNNTKDHILFVKKVETNAHQYGVLMNSKFSPRIVEKPVGIESGNIMTGLYIYQPIIYNIINDFKKSTRGEYEITDLNNYLLNSESNIVIYKMSEDEYWSDMGEIETLKKIKSKVYGTETFESLFNNMLENITTTLK